MRVTRRAFAQFLAVVGLLKAGDAMAQAKSVEVSMANDSLFKPASITINSGDTVVWTNNGVLVHTVTLDPAKAHKAENVALPAGVAPFGSEDLNQDDVYRHTFMEKGTYKYICAYHEEMGMVGTVIVA